MALIEWKDEFTTGIAALDHEHRELIGLINGLYDRLASTGSKHSVGTFLGEIYAKISAHFALEERMMRERRYKEYADHKADHERLLDEIRDIMDRHEAESYFTTEDALAHALKTWFVEHFRTKDARLFRFLA